MPDLKSLDENRHHFEKEIRELQKNQQALDQKIFTLNFTISNNLKGLEESLVVLNRTMTNNLQNLNKLWEVKLNDTTKAILSETKIQINESLVKLEARISQEFLQLNNTIASGINKLQTDWQSQIVQLRDGIKHDVAVEYETKNEASQSINNLESRLRNDLLSKVIYEQSVGLLDHEHKAAYDRLERHRLCRLLASAFWSSGHFDDSLWNFWKCEEFYYYDESGGLKAKGDW